MNRQLEEALVEALVLLEQGTPVVKTLSRYPDVADELRPFLVTARDLNHLATPSSTAAQEASKREFLQVAATMQVKQRKSASVWFREILVSGLAVLFILFFSGAVMAASSNEAIPGDALYGTKLFLEQTRLNYSANPEAAAAMIEELHQERLDEVNALLSLGRDEMVTFSGEVEDLAQDRWVVEGIPVAISSTTIIRDEVEVGFLIQVMGKTSDGLVVAQQVEVMTDRSPGPNPTLQMDPTPLPPIEPLEIPERPELLLPDAGPETSPPAPVPSPTRIHEDDGDTGHEDEGDSDGSQKSQDNDDQNESDGGDSDGSNDQGEDDGIDDREDDDNPGDDDDDDGSEESNDDEEDEEDSEDEYKGKDKEDDSDKEDEEKEDDSDKEEEDEKGKSDE